MFPNVRLLVVAILAAIAGIGSGLGLFATFRVNHEPLVRFSEGGPPLQLALDNRVPLPDTSAVTEARYPLNSAGKTIPSPVVVAPATPPMDHLEMGPASAAVSTSSADAAAAPSATDPKPEAGVALGTPTEQPPGAADSKEPAQGPAEAQAPAQSPAEAREPTHPAEGVEMAQGPAVAKEPAQGPAETQEPAAAATEAKEPVEAAATQDAATQDAATQIAATQDATTVEQKTAAAAPGATVSSGVTEPSAETADIEAAANRENQQTPQQAPQQAQPQAPRQAPQQAAAEQTKSPLNKVAKPPARTVRGATQTRRVAKPVRIRRTPTTVAAQPANQFTQPTYQTYQWADAFQNAQAQPVRRVVVKRRRVPKPAAPVAQSGATAATSSTFAPQ